MQRDIGNGIYLDSIIYSGILIGYFYYKNMKMKRLIDNPLKILSWWLLLEFLFLIASFKIMVFNQQDETLRLIPFYSLESFTYGFIVVCVITPILFYNWAKKYWYLNLGIGIVFLCFLIYGISLSMPMPILNHLVSNIKLVYY